MPFLSLSLFLKAVSGVHITAYSQHIYEVPCVCIFNRHLPDISLSVCLTGASLNCVFLLKPSSEKDACGPDRTGPMQQYGGSPKLLATYLSECSHLTSILSPPPFKRFFCGGTLPARGDNPRVLLAMELDGRCLDGRHRDTLERCFLGQSISDRSRNSTSSAD